MSRNHHARTAMTAIAAVIAAISTPVLAQDVTATKPVTDVETTSRPVSATPDPLAPELVETDSAVEAATTAAEPPAAKPGAPAKPASVARASRSAASSARSMAAPKVEAPAADVAPEAPMPVAADVPPVAEPAVTTPVEPIAVADNGGLNDVLPIAGAAGLGLLALAGAGMAMRRRKRRVTDNEFVDASEWAMDDPVPVSLPEPAFARPAAGLHDSVIADAPVTALPAGFDLSRFGRHVQAAYRGPTADNPSLSLRNRLRRASFFDQQERRAAASAVAPAKAAEAPAWTARQPNNAEFMFRPAGRPAPRFKPAYQG